jgi:hypothetical protein
MNIKDVQANLQIDSYVSDYKVWLSKNKIDLPKANNKELREHDFYHVLSQFSTSPEEEVAIRLIELEIEYGCVSVHRKEFVEAVYKQLNSILSFPSSEMKNSVYISIVKRYRYALPIIRIHLHHRPKHFWVKVHKELNKV